MANQPQQNWVIRAGCVLACCLCFASAAEAWNPLIFKGTCKSSGYQCSTTIGNAGGRGACCDPQSPSVTSCMQNDPCQGGPSNKWPGAVTWSFNPNGLPGAFAGKTVDAYEASLKAAWDTWSGQSCTSFRHTYAGRTTTKANARDRKVVAYFASAQEWANFGFGSRTLAVTRPVTKSTGEVIDADIIFNPNPKSGKWGIHPNVGPKEMDFQDVAAHEIGHAIGFGHAHAKSSLMYYSIRGIGPVFAGLPKDEKDAVCATYPGSGGGGGGDGSNPECQNDTDCASKGACMTCQAGKCVPRTINAEAKSCKGCRSNADCGTLACVSIGGKFRCLQPCTAGCCPSGTTCQEQSGQQLCVPTANQCPALSCSQDSECGLGEACTDGTCQATSAPPAGVCGDGTCQASKENCGNCPQDCGCPSGQTCQNNACQATAPPPQSCGNGACDVAQGENCSTCAQDCACPSGQACQSGVCANAGTTGSCGDGTCGGGENCSTCPQDCGCPAGSSCQGTTCVQNQAQPQCSPAQPCPSGQVCTNGRCVAGDGTTTPSAPGTPGGPCLPGNVCQKGASCFARPNGQTVCMQKPSTPLIGDYRPSGFGCSQTPERGHHMPLWICLLLPAFLLLRRRHP